MPPVTDALARSYLDLRWNFDPAAGTAAGDANSDARLGTFDDVSVRRQLAAYRAMASAVEELEIADLQDEIDRTALLDDIRVSVFRFQHERPHVHDPAFWLSHLFGAYHGLIQRAGEEPERRAAAALARLQATPEFLATATATLRSPPPVMLGTALTMLEGGAGLPGMLAAEFARRAAGRGRRARDRGARGLGGTGPLQDDAPHRTAGQPGRALLCRRRGRVQPPAPPRARPPLHRARALALRSPAGRGSGRGHAGRRDGAEPGRALGRNGAAGSARRD